MEERSWKSQNLILTPWLSHPYLLLACMIFTLIHNFFWHWLWSIPPCHRQLPIWRFWIFTEKRTEENERKLLAILRHFIVQFYVVLPDHYPMYISGLDYRFYRVIGVERVSIADSWISYSLTMYLTIGWLPEIVIWNHWPQICLSIHIEGGDINILSPVIILRWLLNKHGWLPLIFSI